MEIVIGIIVIIFVLILFGKMKGAPEPNTMSESDILLRLSTETSWISKYYSQPISSQQSPSLKRMYEEKTTYIENLKLELVKRQVAQHSQAVNSELEPIFARTAELVKEGMTELEARAVALKEWHERKKS